MSDVTALIEEPVAAPAPELPANANPNGSGIILPPFDPERAIAALKSFYDGNSEEEPEGFDSETAAVPELGNYPPPQPNVSGVVLPPFDPERAIAALQSFYDGDPEEQRETLEYLKRALNEERAAGGERLLFIDE